MVAIKLYNNDNDNDNNRVFEAYLVNSMSLHYYKNNVVKTYTMSLTTVIITVNIRG